MACAPDPNEFTCGTAQYELWACTMCSYPIRQLLSQVEGGNAHNKDVQLLAAQLLLRISEHLLLQAR